MKRSDLEHVLRAASAITLHAEFVVIGSQAILGSHPDAPSELLTSMEVDLYPRAKPEDSALIDGSIGEGSVFHDTFGYYAHGVGPETATLPEGWESRLAILKNANTAGATGLCLEPHDLAISKLVAGRERDLAFVRSLLAHSLVDAETLAAHARLTPVSSEVRALLDGRLEQLADS